ncbi:hypothetical protein DFH09DRAFT_1366616 [Mycena vulgaris]|nr:hypothetical protein DFH09DRAFT_1366616 [Mycena vulgaris]
MSSNPDPQGPKAIYRCPNEIITEIMQATAKPDQASLCQTRLSLPNLQQYHGHPWFLHVIDTNCLREAVINWTYGERLDIDRTILALKSSTRADSDVPFVLTMEYSGDYSAGIVDSVSRHLPNIQTLRLSGCQGINVAAAAETTRRITVCLPRFTRLAHLVLEYHAAGRGEPALDAAADRTAVEMWGDACPTLEGCLLNESAKAMMNLNALMLFHCTADGYAWRKEGEGWVGYPRANLARQREFR